MKAHLGYRIGSEEGGLHYAVVIDTNNAQSSKTVTIIPLTSVKPETDVEHLHPSKVYLGNEIYQSLREKIEKASNKTAEMYSRIGEELKNINDILHPEALDEISKQMEMLKITRIHLKRMNDEISKMKIGSIALVNQITTISKIRIYDPLYPHDTLARIRLSSESLDKLDDKVKTLFTHCN